MDTGSGCNGSVVKHGLLRKLMLSFQANGSALCTFKDLIKWMCYPGNGLTAVSESWYKRDTPSRDSSDVPDVRDSVWEPCSTLGPDSFLDHRPVGLDQLPFVSIGASFSMSIRKNLDGWRILTKGRIHTGSNSSGNVAGHGLQCKPQRSLRVNGSALCIFTDLIRSMLCHGNGLITMRI